MKVAISRKESFNAVHRLFRKDWDDAKNELVFGKCSNPNYHGHNYDLIVTLAGEPDAHTGFVFDMKKLSTIIKNEVIATFDHQNLNLTPYFQTLNPTTENLAVVIWKMLRDKIEDHFDLKIKIYETERNFVEYPAG